MVSLFMQVFSCCLGRRFHEPDIADDQSRLIPATAEPSLENAFDVVEVDQRKLKKRLGSIVRAKEGKMVNVTSHLPFNLYNRTLAALDPSSSRSASTNRESQSPQTYGPPTRSGPRTASPYSAEQSSSRKVSQLRSSSPRSSRRGRSIHSVDGQTEDGELASPRPILNVRLVRRCGPGTSGRRGRKRLKVGESPHPGDKGKGRDLGSDTQPAATVAQNPPEVLDGLDGQMLSSGGDGTASSATLQGDYPNMSPSSCSFPQLSISPASDINFRIQDMGAITLSWDD